ncbi:MAG: hypothetical protein JKY55_01265 [Aliivibrio sp.]|uniref:hypothetical protein n=1 Tax=Aliivibrio sp. TaxID=1872443 RepID=UPI001A434287|nr:hypothetical protein [Aliivibrio sp.]
MKNWLFLLVCIASTVWMVFDSGKSDQVLSMFQGLTLPSTNDLMEYLGQGFYYVTLLIGLVHLGRKFKRQRHNSDQNEP